MTRFDLVTDDGAFQGTGFHGESYIIRYLALKDLRGVQALPNNQTVEQLEQKSTEALRNALEQHFADSYRGTLHMGSSQGACSRCAEFMKSLGIAYVTTQTRDSKREDTWRHPFTMTTKASGNHSRHANSHLWMAPKLVAIRAAKPARAVSSATNTQ
ncbi:MAG: hypothetical protein HY020_11050 [Burkholderiales bacterium]|nr:hypothetical protein [Burkholderiales bacterium]